MRCRHCSRRVVKAISPDDPSLCNNCAHVANKARAEGAAARQAAIVAWLREVAGRPGGASRNHDNRRTFAREFADAIEAGAVPETKP